MATSPRLEDAVEFAKNPEPRCPCILVLDTSGSMTGPPISALNEGLRTFKQQLLQDELTRKRVEVAIVSFDSSVRVEHEFGTVDSFEPPNLISQGSTSMGAAIMKALDLVEARKESYKANGISYYRPWVFLITDGAPTDSIEQASRRIHELDTKDRRGVVFFAVGVENADMGRLAQISTRTPLKLRGLNFAGLFEWLSASMQAVSASKVGEQTALPKPSPDDFVV